MAVSSRKRPKSAEHTPAAEKPRSSCVDLASIRKAYPERAREIGEVDQFIAAGKVGVSSVVYIQGCASTGKTSVVRDVVRAHRVRGAYADCATALSQRLMLEALLNQVLGHKPHASNEYAPWSLVSTANDFVSLLASECTDEEREQVLCMVLDSADLLATSSGSPLQGLLPVFLRLAELARRCTVVFLVSRLPWGNTSASIAGEIPSFIHFPAYLRADLTSIVARGVGKHAVKFQHRDDVHALSSEFARALVSVVGGACRDARELLFWGGFWITPFLQILEEEKCDDALPKVFPASRPLLQMSLDHLYQRDHTNAECERALESARQVIRGTSPSLPRREAAELRSRSVAAPELPLTGKYVAVAGYLASQIPASLDDAIFAAKESRRKRRKSKGTKGSQLYSGTRQAEGAAVSLARLYAIVASIAGENCPSQDEVILQVRMMFEIGLLKPVAGEETWGGIRFRSAIEKHVADAFANSLGIDVHELLAGTE